MFKYRTINCERNPTTAFIHNVDRIAQNGKNKNKKTQKSRSIK